MLFLFAIGFVKLYQHRTERDAFVTTVAVLAITTVRTRTFFGCHFVWGLMIGVGDDMFVSSGYSTCFYDGGSECWITETVGVA